MTRPRLTGFGNLQQLAALFGLLGGLYSVWNTHESAAAAAASAQGAQAETLKRQSAADDQFNTRMQRLWDYLPSLRRDIEAGYRRDIDSACQCCKARG